MLENLGMPNSSLGVPGSQHALTCLGIGSSKGSHALTCSGICQSRSQEVKNGQTIPDTKIDVEYEKKMNESFSKL